MLLFCVLQLRRHPSYATIMSLLTETLIVHTNICRIEFVMIEKVEPQQSCRSIDSSFLGLCSGTLIRVGDEEFADKTGNSMRGRCSV